MSELEAGEMISQALLHEVVGGDNGRIPVKGVVFLELWNTDGNKSFLYYRSKGTEVWDALGMLEFGKGLLLRVEGEDD